MKQIKELEEVDKLLLQRILQVPGSTPTEALYLELGCYPIRYTIMGRRIMYLHEILNRSEDGMLYRFFEAQLKNPVKNDWTEQVKDDLEYLELNYSFDQIKKLKRETFSKKVKNQIKKMALKEMIKVIPSEENKNKRLLSKMEKLEYSELKLQDYFKNKNINTNLARQIFRYRTRMITIGANF